mmetsp:Transcript_17397/g.60092  ORF Transcript_17397/g.60092 Transcript_17397/m.60092 type:complete len:387 (-) Transcript_17397:769-1929(-)
MDAVVLGGEPPAETLVAPASAAVARFEHAADGDRRGPGVELGQVPEGLYLGAVDAERELPDARVREDRAVVVPLVVELDRHRQLQVRDLELKLAGAKVRAKVGVVAVAVVAEVDLETLQVLVDAELEDDAHLARLGGGGGLLGPEADAPRLPAAEGAVGLENLQALRLVRKAAFAELEDVGRPWVRVGIIDAHGRGVGSRADHLRRAIARRRAAREGPYVVFGDVPRPIGLRAGRAAENPERGWLGRPRPCGAEEEQGDDGRGAAGGAGAACQAHVGDVSFGFRARECLISCERRVERRRISQITQAIRGESAGRSARAGREHASGRLGLRLSRRPRGVKNTTTLRGPSSTPRRGRDSTPRGGTALAADKLRPRRVTSRDLFSRRS